jgi:hypothetical protein
VKTKSIIGAAFFIIGAPEAARSQGEASALQSANWQLSARTYDSLNRRPEVWRNAAMAEALLHAVRNANATVASTFRESGGKKGVSDVYGEEFGENLSRMFDTCLKYCDRRALLGQMLVEAQPGSVLRAHTFELFGAVGVVTFSADQRIQIDSALAAGVQSDQDWPVRDAALRAIGVFVRTDPQLSQSRRKVLRDAVLGAVADRQAQVRATVVRRLADFGSPEDLALLQQIAKNDPERTLRNGQEFFPVRDLANSELRRLKLRR